MEDGWIKIFTHRLLNWEWYDDIYMVRLFLHLLLKANFKDKEWHGITIKRGQLVTSLDALSRETHLSTQKLRTCLSNLEKTGEINKQTTNKYTMITVCKYDTYQGAEISLQQTNNNQSTNEQQSINNQTTINQQQEKNIRKKEDIILSSNEDNLSNSDELDVSTRTRENEISLIVEFFNRTIKENNSNIPKIRGATGKRVTYIKARIREYGIDAVYEMITKASKSDFLNGRTSRPFLANFDWLFLPTNFPKVLEGNYDNKDNNTPIIQQRNGTNQFIDPRQAEREQLATGYAATIARLAAEDDARAAELRKP